MNKIGFNQKLHSRKYYLAKKIGKKSLELLLQFALPFILITIMFQMVEKKAWVVLEGNPELLEISDFKGRVDCKTVLMSDADLNHSMKCRITNETPLLAEINGENIELSSGDLQIIYGETYKNKFSNFVSSSTMQVQIPDIKSEKVKLERSYMTQKSRDNNFYKIDLINMIEYMAITIYDKNFDVNITGNFNLYIRNQKYDLSKSPAVKIKFTRLEDNNISNITNFGVFGADNISFTSYKGKQELLLTGNCGQVSGRLEDGNLNFDQTSNEKKYTVGKKEIDIIPYENEMLSMTYSMNDAKGIETYGYVKEATISKNSLFLTFRRWFTENLGTVVGTIIATFLGIIMTKRK